MKVAVYSGSFNPLHVGHLAIMEKLTEDSLYDCVYLVVSPQNPLKGQSDFLSARERLEAAVQAVGRHPGLRVKVDGIEFGMTPPYYTIRTLDELKRREPENDFTLVVGADNLADLRRWKDPDRILREYGLAVFPREGFDMEQIKSDLLARCPDYKIRLISAPKVNVSSTQIRQALSSGLDVSNLLM